MVDFLPRGATGVVVGFDDVANRYSHIGPVAEHSLDRFGLIIEAEDDFVDVGKPPQALDLLIEKWTIEDWHDRFRSVECERTQSRAKATRKQDGLHDCSIIAHDQER